MRGGFVKCVDVIRFVELLNYRYGRTVSSRYGRTVSSRYGRTVSSLTAGLVAVTAWCALGLQFLVSLVLNPVPGVPPLLIVTNVLSYFTILSNLQVALVSTAIALASNPRPATRPAFLLRPTTHAAVAVYITVVGITYSLLLRGIVPLTGAASLADHLLHDTVTVLYPIFWFIFLSPRQALSTRDSYPWLWWPAAYLAYALTRGALHNFHLYPFLNIPR